MDYCQFSSIIFILYAEEVCGVLLAIFLLILIFIYAVKNFKKKDELNFRFINNKKSVIDFIGIVFSVVSLGFFIAFPVKDLIADIPLVINKDFSVATGVVISQDIAGSDDLKEHRGFEISDINSGEVIKIHAIYTPIRLGEIYEVVYLPHTGNGAIVKQVKR